MKRLSERVKTPTAVLSRMAEAGKAGRVLAPPVDLLLNAGWRAGREQRAAQAAAAAWTPRVRRGIYNQIWQDAADHHGAKLQPLSGDFLLISKGDRRTVVWYHTVMLDFGLTLLLALDKVAVHGLLEGVGVPMAAHVRFEADDIRPGLEFLESLEGRSCVVKPASSTSGGEGVTCGVRSADDLDRARLWAWRWGTQVLVEEQAVGQEFRFLFLDGELLDILRRHPPRVVGDGKSTVSELMIAENNRRADAQGRAGTPFLSADLDCLLTLERSAHSLRSVPGDGEVVQVKAAANQNGAAENDTVSPSEVGPALIADAAAAARATDLRFAGVELITPDPSLSLQDAGGLVVEVNGTPGLHYHYLVSQPERAVPIAIPLLDALLDPARTRGYQSGF